MKITRRQLRKLINETITEGWPPQPTRATQHQLKAADKLINYMLANPGPDGHSVDTGPTLEDASREVFGVYWRDVDPYSKRGHFLRSAYDAVGEQIQRRLARSGIDPHTSFAGASPMTPEEQALYDIYHNRIPTSLHGDFSIRVKKRT